jgi:geranylgeranyl diphosphate synthase type I
LGAELAGAKTDLLESLEAYGQPTGIAFQLADDLIGVFGDPARTGKPRGADLTAGKNTPLVRAGKRLLSPKERALLDKILRQRKATPAQLERLVTRLDECGARARVKDRALELRTQGLQALENTTLTPLGKRLLQQASQALTERDA